MKTQEEFTQIIEAENVEAIIPFLKKMTKEDKKELVPFLKKEINRLTQYIQEGNTWSQLATKEQKTILKYAGYVCLNQKEYSSKFRFFETDVIDGVLDFYIPSWLSDYVISSNEGEVFSEITYLWLMEKMEKGLVKYDESLIVNLLCKSIYYQNGKDPIVKNRFKYHYHPENLEKYPATLQEHFWLIFQYETNIYYSDRWINFNDKKIKEDASWNKNIIRLIQEQKLPRQRVLKESINATTRNFNRNLINWYIDLFLRLNPTMEELLKMQGDLFQAFNSTQTKSINEVLKLCKKLVLEKGFDDKSFLENVPILIASETKSIVNSTLMILEKLGKRESKLKSVIALLCCGAFLQTDKSIQHRASKIIEKYGSVDDEKLVSELTMYESEMMSEAKEMLQGFFQRINSESLTDNFEEDFVVVKPMLISEENKIELPNNFDDFVFLVSQVFDGNASWHFDFLPAAILKFHDQINKNNVEKLLPAFQRAQKLIFNFNVNKRVGFLENLLAQFFLEYMIWMMGQYPESEGFQKIINQRNKKEEKKKRDWARYESPTISLEYWNIGQKEEYYFPFKFLLEAAMEKMKSKDNLPLLSTPTHQPYWLNPQTYIKRLSQYQQQNKTPNRADWQMAISRLAPENKEENIKLAKEKLKGEWLDLMLFILQESIVPPKKSAYFNEWKMAIYAKYPSLDLEQLQTQFPTYQVNRKWLGEFDIDFEQVEIQKYFYDSKTKQYGEKPALEARLLINGKDNYIYSPIEDKPNSSVEKYQEKNFFLLQWIYLDKSRFLGYANDISRLFSLSPKNLQPILSQVDINSMRHSTFWEEEDKKLKLISANVLLENWIGGGEIAHLFVATGMVCSDKTIREICAEIWIKGVNENSINHITLGQIIGKLAAIDYFPLKRMTDMMMSSLMKISAQHQHKLEILITEMLIQLPAEPIRNTKKLLEIYQETLKLNGATITDNRLISQLEKWKTNGSLKKIVVALLQ
ncbi:MAG: DUF6493 family protein [Saprospiraceae bacterium]